MTPDFKNIEYLKKGNNRQKLAYSEIVGLGILDKLRPYSPILTGTIPIEIDLPESDLDIICECHDHKDFAEYLTLTFGNRAHYTVQTKLINGQKSTIASFKSDHFTFEIFGQDIPTDRQNAYRHMLIENQLLNLKGPAFKNKIRELKANGFKTEPAFAKALKLKGDPYEELLKWNNP